MATVKFGRYQIIKEIGRGGMATVYHAYDPTFEREVAIKVLPPEFLHNSQFRARFEREAKTIASLEHAAIVPLYDFGEQDGQPYIVMRFMSGGSLEDRLKKGALSPSEAAQIIVRLAPALDAAHQRGIIHRDLKPGNILFDTYGDAFLSDFGIARLTQEGAATLTGGAIIGTPAYMSPEQIQGEKTLDGRSDIYALGIIFFQMLTGKIPYQSDTPAKLMMMHLTDPIPHLMDVKGDLPPTIEPVIEKSLAKDPAQRFGTASEMAQALRTAIRLGRLKETPPPQAPAASAPGLETVVAPIPEPRPAGLTPAPLDKVAAPTAYGTIAEETAARTGDETITEAAPTYPPGDGATIAEIPLAARATGVPISAAPLAPGLEVVGAPAVKPGKAGPSRKLPVWIYIVIGLVVLCGFAGAIAGGVYYLSKGGGKPTEAALVPTTPPEPTQPGVGGQANPTGTPTWIPFPTEASPTAPVETGQLSLMYFYDPGTFQDQAVRKALDEYQTLNPNITISISQVTRDQINTVWRKDVSAGGGPDLYIANTTGYIHDLAKDGLILRLDDYVAGEIGNYSKVALDTVYVNGSIYGLPMTIGVVGIYFDRSKVTTPPANMNELMSFVKKGDILVIPRDIYYVYGFFGAFGGNLMDPNGRCIADQNGFIDAFHFLSELQKAGAIFEPDYITAIQTFLGGKADMMINGYWEIQNFKNALGDKLALAPIPAGEQYPSTPDVETDGIYINPHSNHIKQALDLALYLTSPEGQQILANVGYMPPVRYDVAGIDPIIAEFAKLADSGYIFPKDPGIGNFWNPFNEALANLLNGQSDPKTAVTKACAEMNKLNGK